MPKIKVNGVNLHYLEKGSGNEIIVFSHGLLWSHHMFVAQIEELSKSYRVIAYDHRGQGESEAIPPFDMETLTEDAAELIGELCDEPVHFAGLSMGGFIGMRLASRHPKLIKSLILMETSANAEPVENLPKYKTLNGIVKWMGVISPVARKVMKIMFAESWLEDKANKKKAAYWQKQMMKNKRSISGPVEGVIYRKGVESELAQIHCPTLVIVGDEDVATKPEKAKFIQMGIADAKLHRIAGAGHSSCIEKPEEVNHLILDWLEKQT
ncbi:alpha/beta fold hydrolase [Algoriphagus hitonicola]|uniref:Pimeloyl-ACP methyl ester carboxylesterase n=1 Tax=Algoriphagus hitonicola TaxID=435880 RepID=A0A1I2UIZ6_9BACT|nr:alpha/beta hydrolase [Algoriphagus hitonicola]SFG74816.1 Pimeloyl-ACP methyl ester carboxylesterase [Algoriphagus hitonicola]